MYFVITRDSFTDEPEIQGEFSSLQEAIHYSLELRATALFADVDILEPTKHDYTKADISLKDKTLEELREIKRAAVRGSKLLIDVCSGIGLRVNPEFTGREGEVQDGSKKDTGY